VNNAERVSGLTAAEKRALLARLVRERDLEPKTFPLSYAQERLWFLDRLAPGTPCYNTSVAVYVDQPLDLAVMERALNEMIRRHGALRTNFKEVAGAPVQVVAARLTLPLQVIDIPPLPDAERQAEVLRLATEEARRPYNLAADPLLRVTVLRLDEQHSVFLLGMHHIIADGWSMSVFARELIALCTAFSLGLPSPLPEVRVQYADFAVWQRNWLQGDVLDSQLRYWKKQLANLPALELPTDHPRPAVPGFGGATREFLLPASLGTALTTLAREEGATLFMTLLAGFTVLLHRYSSQDDVVVGAPIANRERTEIEGMIGFFVNMLPMRANLAGNPSFRELLRRVRDMAVDAYAHQSIPFEKVVEAVQPERDLSRNPLFQVTFQLFKSPDSGAGQDLSAPRVVPVDSGIAIFDIAFDSYETAEGIRGQFQYSTDLFDATTIARMVDHLQVLLDNIAADPDRPIGSVPMMTVAERDCVLTEWNQTSASYPADTCVHHLFEERARQMPHRLALAWDGGRFTYAEVDRRADDLAERLQRSGVGTGSIVAVLAERSPELVISMLAVFKAGAIYLPLDASYPRERLAFVLEDSGSAAILAAETLLNRLPALTPPVLGVSWNDSGPGAHDVRREQRRVDPESLAYAIYTSGSSGQPKGVEIGHRGLVNLATWHRRTYGVTADDRATLIANPAFDASVWEMWPYLTTGASIHIPSDAVRAVPAHLVQWIADTGITLCFLPTPLAEAVLQETWPADVALRSLLTGGDRLRQPPKRLPFLLFNHYGPTENTVVTTSCEITEADPLRLPPIGVPISNTVAHVLDRSLNPVPVGIAGELYIGGDGLARGYLNRPELTVRSFVPSPFSSGARLYRSGDLVRRRADGQLEFLGRADSQVKVRGFRVELGEIEAALSRHPAVKESVVVAADERLVAYVVTRAEARPSAAEDVESLAPVLRGFLQEVLPDYMVPSAFVPLNAIPVTANGKVDRRVLPALERSRQHAGLAAPRTEVERALAAIWQDLLGVEHVGIDDNFFEAGGHSLLTIRLHARMKDAFGVDVSMMDLFRSPTIRDLAKLVTEDVVPDTVVADAHERADKQRTAIVHGQQRAEERVSASTPQVTHGQVV
jgi:amino acid adenylation domain-containing protein